MKRIGKYDLLVTVEYIGENTSSFTKNEKYPIISFTPYYAIVLDNDKREHSVDKKMMSEEFVQVFTQKD